MKEFFKNKRFSFLFEESAEAVDEPERQNPPDTPSEQSDTPNSSFRILGGFQDKAIQKVSMGTFLWHTNISEQPMG